MARIVASENRDVKTMASLAACNLAYENTSACQVLARTGIVTELVKMHRDGNLPAETMSSINAIVAAKAALQNTSYSRWNKLRDTRRLVA
mgnify:FL=1